MSKYKVEDLQLSEDTELFEFKNYCVLPYKLCLPLCKALQ